MRGPKMRGIIQGVSIRGFRGSFMRGTKDTPLN
jgi:hypothetical protein